jgi:putative membrane protein
MSVSTLNLISCGEGGLFTMLNYIIRLICCGAAVYFMPAILSKIYVDTFTTAVIVAFVMSILNTFVKPILQLLSLPITILTLGFFYLVVNVFVVYICAYLVPGFGVDGFLQPLIFGFILSIVNGIVGGFQD